MKKLFKVLFSPMRSACFSPPNVSLYRTRRGATTRIRCVALALALPLGWLSGCALEPVKIDRSPPPDPAIIMPPSAPSAADTLQTLLLQAKKMSPAELAIEREKVRADLSVDKSELNRIKLALLLSLPTPGNASATTIAADDAELSALVDPVAAAASMSTVAGATGTDARTSEAELKVLALLIQGNLQDRKRLREQARDALSRTQVAKTDATKREEEARILRTKVEELEKQLAALKLIERSVNSRTKEKPDPVPKEGAPK
jgi:hypothetical protein